MNYHIGINQIGLVKLSPKITLEEASILDYLTGICTSTVQAIIDQRDEEGYTWVNYRHLIAEMPLLRGRTAGALVPKIRNLENYGYIETKVVTDTANNRRKYIRLTPKVDELNFETFVNKEEDYE